MRGENDRGQKRRLSTSIGGRTWGSQFGPRFTVCIWLSTPSTPLTMASPLCYPYKALNSRSCVVT